MADEANTMIVNRFLDSVVYTAENGFSDVERVDDKERQVQGIDVIFNLDGNKHLSDEKAATSWINKGLKTFSFELSFINRRNEIMDGWFLRDDLLNDSYVLVWIDEGEMRPFGTEENVEVLKGVDAILKADIAVVTKSAIKDYLESLGWTEDKLKTKCDAIIENPDGENMGNVFRNGCKFSYSTQLVEKPVNVLLTREKLMEIAEFKYHYIKE